MEQIGSFEHNLTTDLLNHLVFLQKVFMKEVNEVIQKVSGTIFSFTKHLFLHLELFFLNRTIYFAVDPDFVTNH